MTQTIYHKSCPALPEDWDGDLPEYKYPKVEAEGETSYHCELCSDVILVCNN